MIDDKSIEDEGEIAEAFGEYFSTVATNSVNSHFQNVSRSCSVSQHNPNTMFVHPTDNREMRSIIQSLVANKATGSDGVSAKVVKYLCNELIGPLVHIFNLCAVSGVFPSYLKIAKVLPVYKKGCNQCIDN